MNDRSSEWRSVRRLLDLAVLALGILSATAALVSNGGASSARLDLLAQFAAVWLAASGVVLLYALSVATAERGRWLVAIGVGGVVASTPLMLPEFVRYIRPASPGATGFRIKLVEYNAWERNADVAADIDWLVSQNPDFILMTDTSDEAKLALSARGFIGTKGIADTVIFSRLPRARETYVIPAGEWPLLPSFSRASFNGPAGDFTIIATHLKRPTSSASAETQSTALVRLADHYNRSRLILAGDFNSTPWSFDLRRLDRQLGLERRDRAIFTWPALPIAFLPIDHIYAGDAWRTVSITRGPQLGSDHYPVVIIMALGGMNGREAASNRVVGRFDE